MRGEVFRLPARGQGQEQRGRRFAVVLQPDWLHLVTWIVAFTSASARPTSSPLEPSTVDAWRDQAKSRAGSTVDTLIGKLLEHPVVDVSDVMALTGSSYNAANGACDRLMEADVLTPLTQSARGRAWMAADVLDEIDNLNRRVGRRTPP